MEVAMIDDEFIHNNADEIVIFMVKNMNDKASLSRNWKFNMKKEGVSDNITYVGFALAYQNDKNYVSNGLNLLKKIIKSSIDNRGFPKSRNIKQLIFYVKYFIVIREWFKE